MTKREKLKVSERPLHHILPNGIRVLYQHIDIPITYCGFAINVGTRDELTNELGMAHFVEHMLFKGTTKRSSTQIINRLESVGGQTDAYTEKEETYVYSALPSQYTERAVELLSDLLFHSQFPNEEIEKEREVIIDEIESYNDSPSELIYDDFEELLYPNHHIGRQILGVPEVLRTFDSEAMKSFVNRCYTNDRIVFFIMTSVSEQKVLNWCEKYVVSSYDNIPFVRVKPVAARGVERIFEKETNQMHMMIGCEGLSICHEQRPTLTLINNILGGPMMSCRLNMAIRERKALAYTVESSMTAYSDTGLWSVYVGCDEEDASTCERLIYKEINRLRNEELSPMMLERAKRQLLGQMLIASQNLESNILSLSKFFMHQNRTPEEGELKEQLQRITSQEILQLANELFAEKNLVKLMYK